MPELHLAWCCRYMAEMELVGEAIPSMLARAGEAKNTHFTMSLYCSKVCSWTVLRGDGLQNRHWIPLTSRYLPCLSLVTNTSPHCWFLIECARVR